jgi:hypothetical protein
MLRFIRNMSIAMLRFAAPWWRTSAIRPRPESRPPRHRGPPQGRDGRRAGIARMKACSVPAPIFFLRLSFCASRFPRMCLCDGRALEARHTTAHVVTTAHFSIEYYYHRKKGSYSKCDVVRCALWLGFDGDTGGLPRWYRSSRASGADVVGPRPHHGTVAKPFHRYAVLVEVRHGAVGSSHDPAEPEPVEYGVMADVVESAGHASTSPGASDAICCLNRFAKPGRA